MRTWRRWSGRWAAVLAGAALAVAPAAARACDDDDDGEHQGQAANAPEQDKLQDEGARQAYLKSLEKQGVSDEDRARALVRFMADAPISEQTGATILEVASRMKSDRALGKVLSFFHQIQESDLVRGPLAARYLDAASHLESPEALARALVQELHPEPVPDAAVTRALELSQRINSDEGVARVLREVTDHQRITPDIEARVRASAERIHDADLKARALQRLERAKSGDQRSESADRGFFRREFRLPRFAFRFGDEGRAAIPAPPAPPSPPAVPAPPAPPAAPAPPAPPALPAMPALPALPAVPAIPAPPSRSHGEGVTVMPGDGEVIINGHRHALTPEEREALRESVRQIREHGTR
jgi:hypothetical protein